MKPLSILDVRNAVAGKYLIPPAAAAPTVTSVSTDSRQIGPGALFVAIKGDTFDGHAYLEQVAAAGAVGAVVQAAPVGAPPAGLQLILVNDTRVALGKIANLARKHLKGKVIGVAGSNGKTGTKHLIHAALSGKLTGTYSPKSFNNEIGVPLTLLPADPQQDYVVVEMGTNNPGEIHTLTGIAKPDIGVITNCSAEHLQGLGDLLGVKKENASIVEGIDPVKGLLVVNGDDPELLKILEYWKGRKLTFGFGKQNDFVATDVRADADGVRFTVNNNSRQPFFVPLLGRHTACNALAAIAIARRLGLSEQEIAQGLARATGPDMRLQLQPAGSVTILNDAYNANPASMRAALETAAGLSATGRRVAILGDMRKLGPSSERFHREIGQFAATLPLGAVVCVGEQAKLIADAAVAAGMPADRVSHFADSATAAATVPATMRDGDLVLLKGSRGVKLELIANAIAAHFGAPNPPAMKSAS